MSEFLSTTQAAEQTGVSRSYLRSLCRTQKIPGVYQNPQGYWRVPVEGLGHIVPRREHKQWESAEIEMLGTDTDPVIARLLKRTVESVRSKRRELEIGLFPARPQFEICEQLSRMTTERLQELQAKISEELWRRRA